jgi:hypothetical protein
MNWEICLPISLFADGQTYNTTLEILFGCDSHRFNRQYNGNQQALKDMLALTIHKLLGDRIYCLEGKFLLKMG